MNFAEGFAPVFNEESRLLILGSFPSVKSREVGFYYGNKQNRFWKTVCGFFGETVREETVWKRDFLLRRKIALWDVVLSCEIEGSSDASIQKERVADIPALIAQTKIERIFCNGTKSFSLLAERFPALLPITKKLSSTSPANPRFSETEWHATLKEIFGGTYDHL